MPRETFEIYLRALPAREFFAELNRLVNFPRPLQHSFYPHQDYAHMVQFDALRKALSYMLTTRDGKFNIRSLLTTPSNYRINFINGLKRVIDEADPIIGEERGGVLRQLGTNLRAIQQERGIPSTEITGAWVDVTGDNNFPFQEYILRGASSNPIASGPSNNQDLSYRQPVLRADNHHSQRAIQPHLPKATLFSSFKAATKNILSKGSEGMIQQRHGLCFLGHSIPLNSTKKEFILHWACSYTFIGQAPWFGAKFLTQVAQKSNVKSALINVVGTEIVPYVANKAIKHGSEDAVSEVSLLAAFGGAALSPMLISLGQAIYKHGWKKVKLLKHTKLIFKSTFFTFLPDLAVHGAQWTLEYLLQGDLQKLKFATYQYPHVYWMAPVAVSLAVGAGALLLGHCGLVVATGWALWSGMSSAPFIPIGQVLYDKYQEASRKGLPEIGKQLETMGEQLEITKEKLQKLEQERITLLEERDIMDQLLAKHRQELEMQDEGSLTAQQLLITKKLIQTGQNRFPEIKRRLSEIDNEYKIISQQMQEIKQAKREIEEKLNKIRQEQNLLKEKSNVAEMGKSFHKTFNVDEISKPKSKIEEIKQAFLYAASVDVKYSNEGIIVTKCSPNTALIINENAALSAQHVIFPNNMTPSTSIKLGSNDDVCIEYHFPKGYVFPLFETFNGNVPVLCLAGMCNIKSDLSGYSVVSGEFRKSTLGHQEISLLLGWLFTLVAGDHDRAGINGFGFRCNSLACEASKYYGDEFFAYAAKFGLIERGPIVSSNIYSTLAINMMFEPGTALRIAPVDLAFVRQFENYALGSLNYNLLNASKMFHNIPWEDGFRQFFGVSIYDINKQIAAKFNEAEHVIPWHLLEHIYDFNVIQKACSDAIEFSQGQLAKHNLLIRPEMVTVNDIRKHPDVVHYCSPINITNHTEALKGMSHFIQCMTAVSYAKLLGTALCFAAIKGSDSFMDCPFPDLTCRISTERAMAQCSTEAIKDGTCPLEERSLSALRISGGLSHADTDTEA